MLGGCGLLDGWVEQVVVPNFAAQLQSFWGKKKFKAADGWGFGEPHGTTVKEVGN